MQQLRTRPDEAHGTKQNVVHLRNFVKLQLAQYSSHFRNARIVQRSSAAVLIRVPVHGAQLDDMKGLPVIAAPQRRVKNRKAILQHKKYPDDQNNRRDDHSADQREDNVQHTLDHPAVNAPIARFIRLLCYRGGVLSSHKCVLRISSPADGAAHSIRGSFVANHDSFPIFYYTSQNLLAQWFSLQKHTIVTISIVQFLA